MGIVSVKPELCSKPCLKRTDSCGGVDPYVSLYKSGMHIQFLRYNIIKTVNTAISGFVVNDSMQLLIRISAQNMDGVTFSVLI